MKDLKLKEVNEFMSDVDVPTFREWCKGQPESVLERIFGKKLVATKEDPNDSKHHLRHVNDIASADAHKVHAGESNYKGSWKRRGGVGAFMMLARKWDRIDARCEELDWNIFDAILNDPRPEGLIDDIRDLRQYLILVEAEMVARGVKAPQVIQ